MSVSVTLCILDTVASKCQACDTFYFIFVYYVYVPLSKHLSKRQPGVAFDKCWFDFLGRLYEPSDMASSGMSTMHQTESVLKHCLTQDFNKECMLLQCTLLT